MLIDDLIRLGRPLLQGDMKAEEVLRLITDISDVRAKNYYRHVLVVELPPDDRNEAKAMPIQMLGEMTQEINTGKKRESFLLDRDRVVGAPVIIPSGNPIQAQGRYGVPVYPCWEKHFEAFQKSATGVLQFLHNKKSKKQLTRLDRTIDFNISPEMLKAIANEVHRVVALFPFPSKTNKLGILILARCRAEDVFEYAHTPERNRIGESRFYPGQYIVPNYQRILDATWRAKVEEGREAGSRPGACSFTGKGDNVLSAYCKAWPWALPTWTCPLPNAGNEKMLVEGVGVAPETYRALTLGASVFNKLTKRVSHLVIPEIFSPSETRPGKEQAQRRKISYLPPIYGSAFLLPIQDRWVKDEELQGDFVQGVRGLLEAKPNDPTFEDRYITSIIGFEAMLPPFLDTDDFSLTLVYFSGRYTRGDIHLRAYIQDVIPSTLKALRDMALRDTKDAMRLLHDLMRSMSDKQAAYYAQCYSSVPYRLARAYGGAYVWQQLETVLHRRLLRTEQVTTNAARRMASLSPHWPDSRYALYEEVGFYLSFLQFLELANREIANPKEGTVMPMRPWKDLIRVLEREPVESIEFKDDKLAELGFACGLLIRRFSAWYAGEFKRKDYLKERVLTFGANLSPREVWVLGLKGIRDVASKFDKLRLAVDFGQLGHYPKEERKQHYGDYARRLGLVLSELERRAEHLDKHRDEFMTGFWAGYSLQGYDRPKTKTPPKQTAIVTKE